MNAKYKISEDDYLRASKLFGKLTRKAKLVLLIGFLALVVVAVFSPRDIAAGVVGGLVGGGAVILLLRYVVSPFVSRRHYRKYKAIQDEFSLCLLDNGVQFSSSTAEGIVLWDSILKWRQDETYILIYPMPRLYHIVPKSIAADGFDIEALVEKLNHHVGHES